MVRPAGFVPSFTVLIMFNWSPFHEVLPNVETENFGSNSELEQSTMPNPQELMNIMFNLFLMRVFVI
jgi:hypothetical protein